MMNEKYRQLLVRNRPQLVDEIELESGSGLLNVLLSKGVLTKRQTKSISCLVDPYKQTEALLDALHRRPDNDFRLFCDALRDTRQQHIVENYLVVQQQPASIDTQALSHVENYLVVQQQPASIDTQALSHPISESSEPVSSVATPDADQEPQLKFQNLGIILRGRGAATEDVLRGPAVSRGREEDLGRVITRPHRREDGEEHESDSGRTTNYRQQSGQSMVTTDGQSLQSNISTSASERTNSASPNLLPTIMSQAATTTSSGPRLIDAIKVKLSNRDFYEQYRLRSYEMCSRVRGLCVIVNVNAVKRSRDPTTVRTRDGSDLDVNMLKQLFTQLHFSVQEYYNLTAQEMKDVTLALSQDVNLESSQCLILIVMSHGNTVTPSTSLPPPPPSFNPSPPSSSLRTPPCFSTRVQNEVVYGADGVYVSTRDLLAPLTNQNCSYLRGKPRIVLFQACRGTHYDTVVTDTDSMTDSEVEAVRLKEDVNYGQEFSTNSEPAAEAVDLSDFIIGFPTQAGFRSFRSPYAGSWYINAIIQVFMQCACNMDVSAMLRKVNEMVSTWIPNTVDLHMIGRGQIACISDNLKKPFLYLFPGIIVD